MTIEAIRVEIFAGPLLERLDFLAVRLFVQKFEVILIAAHTVGLIQRQHFLHVNDVLPVVAEVETDREDVAQTNLALVDHHSIRIVLRV